jgi:hypothetical protein
MAKGNEIIVSAEPQGRFIEGIISGALKPGICVQLVAATEPVGGRFTWGVYDAAADGDQRLVAVLLPDSLQGKLATDAYVSGDRCFLYCPIAGEELNMLVTDPDTGTTETWAIGDLLMIDDGTGKLIDTTGSPEMESFICLETFLDPTSTQTDYLIWCMYTGH